MQDIKKGWLVLDDNNKLYLDTVGYKEGLDKQWFVFNQVIMTIQFGIMLE